MAAVGGVPASRWFTEAPCNCAVHRIFDPSRAGGDMQLYGQLQQGQIGDVAIRGEKSSLQIPDEDEMAARACVKLA